MRQRLANPTRILAAAQTAVDAAAEIGRPFVLTVHVGDRGHRALKVYGCPISEAQEHCAAVAEAIRSRCFGRDYPAVRINGGDALVWYH